MLTPQRRVSIQHLQHETRWIRWFNIRGNTMLETNRFYVLCICTIGIHKLIRQHIHIEGELCLLTMTLHLGMITLTNDQLPVNTCNQSPGLDRWELHWWKLMAKWDVPVSKVIRVHWLDVPRNRTIFRITQIARLMGPTWGLSGADRTQGKLS